MNLQQADEIRLLRLRLRRLVSSLLETQSWLLGSYEGIPRRSLEKLVFEFLLPFSPSSRLGLQRPALESSFPQFLPGFALDCFYMDATDPKYLSLRMMPNYQVTATKSENSTRT